MNFEFLKKLNWVDIFVILFFLRTLYIGLKRGFVVEFFKLLGVLVAVVVSLHYYTRIGDFLNAKSPLPLDFADFISLLVLASLITLLFKFIRDGFTVLFKTEVKSSINKAGGFLFSSLRAFALGSLILILMFSTTLTYFKDSIRNSFSQGIFLKIAPRIYSTCFENIMVKFFPNEQLNTSIFDSIESTDNNK